MALGMHGDADREVPELAHQLDEVGRMREFSGREVQVLGRVAAEAQDVLDAGRAVARHDARQLVAGMRRAREVGHRGERRLAVDADDDVVRASRGSSRRRRR